MNWESGLAAVAETVKAIQPRARLAAGAIDKWQADAAAAMFHLSRVGRDEGAPILVCILGGTGTGKSTLVNRLLEANLSTTSFQRTFTAGPVAVAADPRVIPNGWLGLPQAAASALPARGDGDHLTVAAHAHPLTAKMVLVDTPDLDGDQPVHHAQADRVFRWAEAIVFLVSPEKYQMTELLPYYRLARRYALPALFVMNKCECDQALEDYRKLLERDDAETSAFAIPRDDAAYEPPAAANLAALRARLGAVSPPQPQQKQTGAALRLRDLLSRLRDQIIGPLQDQQRQIAAAAAALRAMETPPAGVDVNPITVGLQRRLQQRSVLYLIGPGRVLDRIRQVPGMLVRLPRTAWDLVLHGRVEPAAQGTLVESQLPDFAANLRDQFRIVQSRIEDVLRSFPASSRWLEAGRCADCRIDPDEAGKIATEELDDLKEWLQRRWNATPRDTALLLKLLRYLPGGKKLTQWTEASPYLLAIIVATHHAFFGHVDLMILGGYTLATWITERLSNEVAARTRRTNGAIAERFERLAHEQIRRCIEWLEAQAPAPRQIAQLQSEADRLEGSLPP
ncbi:MAG: GTPase domain-containing protein [Tepidisphaeraceae bacterium]|jgi:hypothetical protein